MLREALRADPRLAPAAFNLAVLVGERDPAQGMSLARRAADLAPEEPRYAFTFAWFQVRTGDLAGAAGTLEALLAAHPGDPDARALLGQVRARQARKP
jgi:cytochrome c-type biogenesis protein CcmH/NrfG